MSNELVPPGLTYLAGNIASKQNILGVSKEQSARWAKGLNLPKASETIFFAGCGYQFSNQLETLMSLIRKMDKSVIGAELPMRFARFQKNLGIDIPGIYSKVLAKGDDAEAQPLKSAIKVLRNYGIQPGYLAEDEPCCGAPMYASGLHKEFGENAQKAYQKLKSFGVKRIIGMVPSCTHALRTLFPQFIDGFDLEVKHFLDVVAENISSQKQRFPRQVKVTYHDPCQLGRYLGIIDEPRRILSSIEGIELVEPEWTRGEWATCCGGGGGFEAVFPELSQILAVNRAGELLETGAEIITTNCPGCLMQLKEGVKELKAEKVEVLDFSQILAMAMEN
ncbi:(Fe-S)-binding protein [Chloroflexota bacterium]